jgi:hypothetical protein
MKKTKTGIVMTVVVYVIGCVLLSGCESLRFAPNEIQKQNAWLHNRTAIVTAETARTEQASEQLQALTKLGEIQSRAFSSYFGLPEEFPKAESAENILSESNFQLANAAVESGAERPDGWQVTDSMLELGIGICAILGGVGGTKAARFLTEARAKSKALQEIITGNELFKKQNTSQSEAFKQAHINQSPQTRQFVVQMKI